VIVPTDLAVPLRLLVNELMTNAFKYAYARGLAKCGSIWRQTIRSNPGWKCQTRALDARPTSTRRAINLTE
jgi:anti-sigma regulatory factor (Ser/Thr protein kinase)